MRAFTQIIAIAALTLFAVSGQSPAATSARSEAVKRLEDFRRFFVDFQMAPDRAAPADLIAQCHGIIIQRQYKAGFVFGFKGGDGVIFLRDRYTGAWSPPAFIATAEGSFGFQIGGQAVDAIILIMNDEGVNMLLKSRFQIGVDASAAAGPVGRDAAAKVGPGTALLAYSRAKGLYAGVSFEGGAFLNNDKLNRGMYGMEVGVRDILFGGAVAMPPEAMPMIQTLQTYAGGRFAPYQAPASPTGAARTTTGGNTLYPAAEAQFGSAPLTQPDNYAAPYYAEPEPAYSGPSQEQLALEQAAVDAQRAAQEAAEAAARAQQAADAAASRAAAARGGY